MDEANNDIRGIGPSVLLLLEREGRDLERPILTKCNYASVCACASEVYGSVFVCVCVCVWTATAAEGSTKCK